MFHDRAAHMRDSSAPRNPSHGDLRCELCPATMRNERGMTVHMSRMHGVRSRRHAQRYGR